MKLYAVGFAMITELAVAIVLFYFLGAWADKKFGTEFLTIAGVLVGFGLGFGRLYQRVMAISKAEEKRDKNENGQT